MLKVGIVGCGTIGSSLVKEILKKYKRQIKFVGVCDIDEEKINSLRSSLGKRVTVFSLDELIKRSDLIIEAASAKVAPIVVEKAMAFCKDVMVMSVGGLLRDPRLLDRLRNRRVKLYIPSGAIAGLDALKAARMGKIESVTLTTQKPWQSLLDAPFVKNKKINLEKIKTEKLIFQGSAQKAVSGFPQNINVAAVLSLAGSGAKKTKVRIIASRLTKRNKHTIEIRGDFGTIICCTENVPAEINPKTSKLAILSALATLDGILNNIRIGT